MENQNQLLRAIELIHQRYTPLSAACQSDLLKRAQHATYLAGHQLVREGEFADDMFLVLQGVVRAYYLKDGRDISDWFAFEGDFICAINSYFMGVPSPHYIELLEDSELIVIAKQDVDWLMEEHRDFERLGYKSVTKTMLDLQQRIVALQFEPAKQKYENLLERYPAILQRVSLSHIASFLGITLETLSRIRRP